MDSNRLASAVHDLQEQTEFLDELLSPTPTSRLRFVEDINTYFRGLAIKVFGTILDISIFVVVGMREIIIFMRP